MKRLVMRISIILIIFGITLGVLIFGFSKLPHSIELGDIKKGNDGIYYKVLVDETNLKQDDQFLSYFYYGNYYYDQDRQITKFYNSRIVYAKLTVYADDVIVYELDNLDISHINHTVTFDSFGKVKYLSRETIQFDLPLLNESGKITYKMDYFDNNHAYVICEDLTIKYVNNNGSIKISK